MTPSQLKAAREKYAYVPARLVRVGVDDKADLSWNSLRLKIDAPERWDTKPEIRSRYSSFELDEFHHALLQGENDEDLMHGLLSVVFWGYSSAGGLARTRTERILNGKKNASPQDGKHIISHLKLSRDLLKTQKIDKALLEAVHIKGLGMSFGSKVLAFMEPVNAAVYDSKISKWLEQQNDP